jgi:hypothetical protein
LIYLEESGVHQKDYGSEEGRIGGRS